MWHESYRDDDAVGTFDGESAIQLLAQALDQDQSHRLLFVVVEIFRKADAIVFYLKTDYAGFYFTQRDIDLAFPVIGEGIFDRVRNCLVQDYADGQRFGDIQRKGGDGVGKHDLATAGVKCFVEVIDDLKNISRHVHTRYHIEAIQLLMEQGDRLDPVLRVLQCSLGGCIVQIHGLRIQEADDQLEVVFDPVVDLF